MPHTPAIAVIIPALNSSPAALVASLANQTLQPLEVEVILGVRPNGRARNLGVARTTAEFLVFIDDDAQVGDATLLQRLVDPLLADPTIGVSGAAKLLPPDAPPFQRWVGREVPRIEHPIVAVLTETNPDPPSYYCEITTTCCAMRREVFEQVGGFSEELVRGVDTEFFVRVRRAEWTEAGDPDELGNPDRGSQSAPTQYHLVLAPHTWVYHPAPASLPALLRKQFWYGAGHAQEVRADPSRARGRFFDTRWHALAFLLFRTAIVLPNVFLPYSYANPSWRVGFKPLKALASYVSAIGYVWGWYVLRVRVRRTKVRDPNS
jgi:glycosyltransferase involved in cell wall biosynthesis